MGAFTLNRRILNNFLRAAFIKTNKNYDKTHVLMKNAILCEASYWELKKESNIDNFQTTCIFHIKNQTFSLHNFRA